jgi:hypothetical protein
MVGFYLSVWVILSLAGLAPADVEYYAVICGIADYPPTGKGEEDLPYCDNDASDLKQALLSSVNWREENINMQINSAATKSSIQEAINDIRFSADSDDVCLFFFAGHGGTLKDCVDPWESADLPPIDELDGSDEFIGVYDDGDGVFDYDDIILDDELAQWISDLSTRKYVVLLDTCRSGEDEYSRYGMSILGSLRKVKGIGNTVPMKGDGFIEDIAVIFGHDSEINDYEIILKDFDDYDKGVAIAACEADETSAPLYYTLEDGTIFFDAQNGLFTYYLLQGMAGPADENGNDWISAEECYNYVRPRAEYIDISNSIDDEPNVQHAKMYDGHPGELDFLQLPNCVQPIYSFETGDFDPNLPWRHSGDARWIINDEKPFKPFGAFSAGSGEIRDDENSTLELTWDFPTDGYITFWRKVSSEPYFDHLKFSIDGKLAGIWSGDGDLPDEGWAKVGFPVSAGPKTLSLTYSKDQSYSEGFDRAWIDDISFRFSSCPCPLYPPDLINEPLTSSGNSNKIVWNPISGANIYYAQCARNSSFSNIFANSGWISKTDYTFTGLSLGQRYYYRVKSAVAETWVQTSKPDFEHNTSTHTATTSEGDVVLENSTTGIPVTNTVGSIGISYTKASKIRLVAYECTKPCALVEIKMHLNIPFGNSVETQFLVYESYTKSGQYTQIYAGTNLISGRGDAFYSSGPIAVFLEPGRYYTIGSAWKQSVKYFWGPSNSEVSFGNAFGYVALYPYPPSEGHTAPVTDNWYYHQEVVTEPKEYISLGGIVSTQIDLPSGDWNWGVLAFNSTTPSGTVLTIDVLNALDDTNILTNVSSGRDISGLGLPPSIKLKANLRTNNSSITPALNDWLVTKVSCESGWSNVTNSRQN